MIVSMEEQTTFQNDETVKILLVENELEAKASLVKMLGRRFKHIFTASNGEEGFLLYKHIAPDVIITDIKMSPMNGLEMIRLIREQDQDTQIIITTAHDENDYFIKAIEYGVNHFILKPIYQEQFLTALQKSIHQITLEEQIKKQKLFTKTVLDFQEDLILTLSETNELLDCNEAFIKFTGSEYSRFHCLKSLNMNSYLAGKQPYIHHSDFYEMIDSLLLEKDKKHYKVNFCNHQNEQKTLLVKARKIPNENNVLVVCTDITELEEEIKKNEFLASRDPMTKLFNRYKFESLLDQEVRRAIRYQKKLSLILFDIDHFKTINDLYGHSAGDEVLIEIAKLAKERIRTTDLLARWGGEEFVVILPETDVVGANLVAESLREMIAEHRFSVERSITSSFGVCQFNEPCEPKDLIRHADIALYTAKNQGRNCVVVADRTCEKQRGLFNGDK